jgi:hypothetical protein
MAGDGVSSESGKVYIAHINRCWDSETENASRFESRVRLLITVVLTLTSAVLFRLSQDLSTFIESDQSRLVRLFLVLVSVLIVYLVWDSVRRSLIGGVDNDVIAATWAGAIVATLLIAGTQSLCAAILRDVVVVLAFLAVWYWLCSLEWMLYPKSFMTVRLSRTEMKTRSHSDHEQDSDDRMTASNELHPDDDDIRDAAGRLSNEQWSVFLRVYKASLDLAKRNARIRKNIREAQNLLARGIVVLVAAVILYILLTAVGAAKGTLDQ